MPIATADVVEALSGAWQAFQEAARHDVRGWDMASASVDVRPEDGGLP
jgi:hypothetical protein